MEYHVRVNGSQTVLPEERLHELHGTGQLTDEDVVWDEPNGRWITISSFCSETPTSARMQPPPPTGNKADPYRTAERGGADRADRETGSRGPSASAMREHAQAGERGLLRVTVVDVDMKFWTMVQFMVKWAFASIPALLIIILIGFAVLFCLSGFVATIIKAFR